MCLAPKNSFVAFCLATALTWLLHVATIASFSHVEFWLTTSLVCSPSNFVARWKLTCNIIVYFAAFCFARQVHGIADKVNLLFLCRADGTNMEEFHFVKGSTVAYSYFRMVTSEGVEMLHEALKLAASYLR